METSNTTAGVEALMALVDEYAGHLQAVADYGTREAAADADKAKIKLRTALESLSGGAQPVAKVDFDHAGGVKWLCNYADIPKDTQLYTRPPLSAGEAVAPWLEKAKQLAKAYGEECGALVMEEHGKTMSPQSNRRAAWDALVSHLAASGEAVAQPVGAEVPATLPSADSYEAFQMNGRAWATNRWRLEVENRPMVNGHRRTLDDTWRQVIRYFDGDPDKLCGPSHDARAMAEFPGGFSEGQGPAPLPASPQAPVGSPAHFPKPMPTDRQPSDGGCGLGANCWCEEAREIAACKNRHAPVGDNKE